MTFAVAPRSMRWRLQAWLGFLLATILCGFGITAYQLHRTNRLTEIDQDIEQRLNALRGGLRFRGPPEMRPPPSPVGPPNLQAPPDPAAERPRPWRGRPGSPEFGPSRDELFASPPLAAALAETVQSGFYYAIWTRSGTLLRSSTNAPATLVFPGAADPGSVIKRLDQDRREVIQFNTIGECLLVGRSIAPELAAIRRFALWLVAAGTAVLALGLGGGWALVSHAIRPIHDISTTATRVAAGRLDERIPIAEPGSELADLASVLNTTFARLEAAFHQQRQFTADASHELRTPIAVLISEAQTALARPRAADEYRETVEACLETAQKMRRLTESLLQLARLDAGHDVARAEPLDLAQLAADTARPLEPLAAARQVTIETNLSPTPIHADPAQVQQVLTNLVANAIEYNRPNGHVHIRVTTRNNEAVLDVTDTGVGIESLHLPHIFDRFYRADPSRSSTAGHAGLGLAICRMIMQAHGGRIDVQSQPGQGSTFTATWPLRRPAQT